MAVACVTIPTFSVGGSVSGLVGQGLELDLGVFRKSYETGFVTLETLGISKNKDFAFATPVPSGTYRVAIARQPNSPTQRCVVRNRYFGIAAANVTNVEVACGEFAYVTNGADNTISAFSVDATTGAIASADPPVTAGVSPLAIVGTVDRTYLYVANSGGNDLSAFAVDPVSGALTGVLGSSVTTGANPKALALYNNSFLFVANSGSNSLSAYQVDPNNGVPTPLSPASYATGAGPSVMAIDTNSGLLNNSGVLNPFLYIANTGGSNDISAFLVDGSTGSLTPVVGSPFPSGSSVSSIALGAIGRFLYAADVSGGTAAIYGFTVEAPSGALTPLAGFPHLLPACKFIVADQTSAYLYAVVGTNLLGYSIDEQFGALSPLPGFPVSIGANADSLTIDPTNQFLYVRNGSAGTVTGFNLKAATGALTPMPGSPFAVGKSADFFVTL